MAKLYASEAANRDLRPRCRSTAATATCATSPSSGTCATCASRRIYEGTSEIQRT
jgi:hypothetical protein